MKNQARPGRCLVGMLASASLLGACGGPQRVQLSDATLAQIKEIEVHNAVGQDEIVVRPEAFGGGYPVGGLIGALVQSKVSDSQQSNIHGSIEPLYASIDDVDVRRQLGRALEEGLKTGMSLPPTRVTTTPVLMNNDALLAARTGLTEHRALLSVVSAYTFSPDYSRVEMTAMADLYQAGKPEPVYSNVYYYHSTPVGESSRALSLWGAGGGEKYRKAIDDAAQQVTLMITLDLAARGVETGAPATASYRMGPQRIPATASGPRLLEQPGRVIFRNVADGRVFSIAQ